MNSDLVAPELKDIIQRQNLWLMDTRFASIPVKNDRMHDKAIGLRFAVKVKADKVIEHILKHDELTSDVIGWAIYDASSIGYLDGLQLLLAHPEANLFNIHAKLAIQEASINDHLEIVEALVESLKRKESNAKKEKEIGGEKREISGQKRPIRTDLERYLMEMGGPALAGAAQSDNFEIIRFLLQFKGINVEYLSNVVLIKAASKSYVDIVISLLNDHKARVNYPNFLPLERACQYGCVEVAELLLPHAVVDPLWRADNCLSVASFKGHTDVVRLLLQAEKTDPSARQGTIFDNAVRSEYYGIVRMYLKDSRVYPYIKSPKVKKLLRRYYVEDARVITWACNEIGNGWADISEPLMERIPYSFKNLE